MTLHVCAPASPRRTSTLPPEQGPSSPVAGGSTSPRGSAQHADHALAGASRGRSASTESPASRARSASPARTAPHALSLRATQERTRNLLKATAHEQLRQAQAMTVAQRNALEAELEPHLDGGSSVAPGEAMALWMAVQNARLQSSAPMVAPAGWLRTEAAKGIDNLMRVMTDPALGEDMNGVAAKALGDHFQTQGPGPFLAAMGYEIHLDQIPPSELAFAAHVRHAMAESLGDSTVASVEQALQKYGVPAQILPLLGAGAASQQEAMAVFGRYQAAMASAAA
ncbi:hypothetical protein [Paracidovorax konjaci]|uniref:Uncharacterized protein n=1 Tax=Paracidovorax konjaci TaxID=32040 RepID=A0A1I1UUY8_9BURK|nr:hypothetical protein [Paracidovorax konjaci]SFD72673.1 hypothetical protein SAMN04489710_105197 [Paracidovorax konjaci]